MQQLLADLTAGRVDIVVVYKIDRLTRSLADFAKIVEILDARGASFVSVTQQFNTTTWHDVDIGYVAGAVRIRSLGNVRTLGDPAGGKTGERPANLGDQHGAIFLRSLLQP